MAEYREITIIGASISGLSAAKELVERMPQAKITVYETKGDAGERIVCGGGMSKVMMDKVGLEVPKEFIASPIHTVRVYAPNKRYWEFSGAEDYGYVIYRDRFETWLAEDLQKKGVTFKFNNPVTYRQGFLYDGICDQVLIEFPGESVFIGADGISGASTQYLEKYQKEDMYIGVQLTAEMEVHKHDLLECYFGSRYAPKGYAWVFPEGYNKVRVGLGVPSDGRENVAQLLKNFVDDLGAQPVTHMEAKMLPTGKPPNNLVFSNLLLVGDAGHLCDPLHGGGIANAIASGKAAARAIAEGKLERYNAYVSWIMRANHQRYRYKNVIVGMGDEDLNELVRSLEDFKPATLRLSWALMQAVVTLALKNRRLLTKHKVLRRLI